MAFKNTKGHLYCSVSLFLLISNPFSYILLDGFSQYCLDTFVRFDLLRYRALSIVSGEAKVTASLYGFREMRPASS